MSRILTFTVRFLQPYSHGSREGGEPEWPPSPLRFYQALVAAAAGRWNEREVLGTPGAALAWLASRPAPTVVAPAVRPVEPYRLSVPNNALDIVGRAWARGNDSNSGDANPATHRALKDVRPVHLVDGDAVRYLYRVDEAEVEVHRESLAAAARSLTHLGWGIDMVVGNAEILSTAEADSLPGERWHPVGDSQRDGFRVPVAGTLDDLIRKHAAFLSRIARDDRGQDTFRPVPPLSAFRVVGYRRAGDPAPRSVAAFSLLRPGGEGFRPFDAVRRTKAVAGMLRHATKQVACAAWGVDPKDAGDDPRIAAMILGHGERRGESHRPVDGPRLAYLPLPSIQPRGGGAEVVGDVRRVLVALCGPDEGLDEESRRDFDLLVRRLGGTVLIPEPFDGERRNGTGAPKAVGHGTVEWDAPAVQEPGTPIALLGRLPTSDSVVRRFVPTGGAAEWATVTPIVLHGHDDRRPAKREKLLRAAIRQAGYSEEIAANAECEMRSVAFWPGCDLASRYRLPRHLDGYARHHVRIRWRDAAGRPLRVPGPLCLGLGRFFGFGLFAACDARSPE